jgi:Sortase (surface protein transpeptidase)
VVGNTVISGHHNAFGKVFEHLIDLEVGDEVIMLSGIHEFYYVIVNKMILPEKEESLDRRLQNARWILSSTDERLTLVTCWPANSNSHRLILVAVPEENPSLPHSRALV